MYRVAGSDQYPEEGSEWGVAMLCIDPSRWNQNDTVSMNDAFLESGESSTSIVNTLTLHRTPCHLQQKQPTFRLQTMRQS